ncbi:MAG: B12-binding domain-containing radical SAM protein, partial [Candidatus Hodarchaeales archaeon]
MKHICLIIPPSPFLLDERVFVSLGILKVAAVLEKAGHRVDVIDLSGIENYRDVLDDYDFTKIDFLGLTATTPQMPYIEDIVRYIYRCNMYVYYKFRVILGGPHVSLMNAAYKMEQKRGIKNGRAKKNLDEIFYTQLCYTMVCGDGEKAILKVIESDPSEFFRGIVDADDRKSDLFLSDQEFSNLPLPARHLIDMDSYHYNLEGVKATSIVAQLGCPFECTFCGGRNSPFLRKIRLRTPKNVVEEIEFLYKEYGYTGIMFYDDELNVNRQMIPLMNQICDLSDRLGVDFKLRGF